MRLNIRSLIYLFDEDEGEGAGGDVSAVKAVMGEELGLALLVKYFKHEGRDAEIVSTHCTTGAKQRCRLDGWVLVRGGDTPKLYQVEVKTWASHSVGGRRLAVDAPPEEQERHRLMHWRGQYWDGKDFRDKELQKVWVKMNPPTLREPVQGVQIETLASLWDSVHPEGLAVSFFEVPLVRPPFDKVNVFSMSTFLRSILGEETIDLKLDQAERRLTHLTAIFPDLRLGTGQA